MTDIADKQSSNRDPLSAGYRSARKMCGLFAGLLLGWEVFRIRPAENGDIDTPIGNWKADNPDAMPWVLACLVIYFLVRLALEYRISVGSSTKYARWDHILTWYLCGGAVLYSITQSATGRNLFEAFTALDESALGVYLLTCLYGMMTSMAIAYRSLRKDFLEVSVVLILMWGASIWLGPVKLQWVLILIVVSSVLFLPAAFWMKRADARSAAKREASNMEPSTNIAS